ncbi:MAG: trans-aconitate 2-methyltransferase [Ramlibacter sp.]
MNNEYERKLHEQKQQYVNAATVHDLPAIFHYWSNKHLRPRLRLVTGADSAVEFYGNAFLRSASKSSYTAQFASLGAGDATIEVAVAQYLRQKGLDDFRLVCHEVAPVLVARANERIAASALQDHVAVERCDLNTWIPAANSLDGVMASHSLHHMVALESIFDAVARGLKDGGVFVTNDVIGRNGHLRWPEVKAWIDNLWPMLPNRLKHNHALARFEENFSDWDCSVEGFEGIRAQDILPLLVSRFSFAALLPYGGLVDVFVDRGFGHNFSLERPEDLALLDFLEFANEELIDSGRIKPTMIFAEMGKKQPGLTPALYRGWSPDFCIRPVNASAPTLNPALFTGSAGPASAS